MSYADPITDTLAALRAEGLYRRLVAVGPAGAPGPRVTVDGREVLVFASNNYLALAGDPRVTDALRRGADRWGWGAGASRLLAGHTEAHAALEADLAAFMGAEAALVFPSGYTANLGAVTALAGRRDTLVMDRACHASLYDAAALARVRLVRYPQCDAAAAAEALDEHSRAAALPSRRAEAEMRGRSGDPPRGKCLLVADAVFSMDGRRAPLSALAGAAQQAGAMLLLDEAHAIGVLGESGAGLAEEIWGKARLERCHPERAERVEGSRRADDEKKTPGTFFVRIGTLSKALGGVGGFVAASQEGIDLLVNRARPFIYTTALPPAACEAAREALRILRTEPERRARLHALARRLRTRLAEEGFDVGTGDASDAAASEGRRAVTEKMPEERPPTPIVPIVIGDADRAMALAAALLDRGLFCPAVRPPTVPPGTSRLRVSLTAGHTEEDVERLVAALVEARDI